MNSPDRQDRVLPLLVGLKSSDEVQSIMGLSKLLRRSTVECVRNNVFINYNKTKLEQRFAYEERCRRRRRQQLQSSVGNVRSTPDQMTSAPASELQSNWFLSPSKIGQ